MPLYVVNIISAEWYKIGLQPALVLSLKRWLEATTYYLLSQHLLNHATIINGTKNALGFHFFKAILHQQLLMLIKPSSTFCKILLNLQYWPVTEKLSGSWNFGIFDEHLLAKQLNQFKYLLCCGKSTFLYRHPISFWLQLDLWKWRIMF